MNIPLPLTIPTPKNTPINWSFLSLREQSTANPLQIVRMTNRTNENESYLLSDEACVMLSTTSSIWIDCSTDHSEITTRLYSNDPRCAGPDFMQSTEEAPVSISNIGNIGSGFTFSCDAPTIGFTSYYTVTIFGDAGCKDTNLRFNVRVFDCFNGKSVSCSNGTLTERMFSDSKCQSGTNTTEKVVNANTCLDYPEGGMIVTCHEPEAQIGNEMPLWVAILLMVLLVVVVLVWLIRPLILAYFLASSSRSSGEDSKKSKKDSKKNLDDDEDFDPEDLKETKKKATKKPNKTSRRKEKT